MILFVGSALQIAAPHQSELVLFKTTTALVLSHHFLPDESYEWMRMDGTRNL
jgi:hypothetical protein